MLGPPLARSTMGFCDSAGISERRMPRVQHQRVGMGQQRHDGQIDPLQARGRSLEIAVVDGQHHGAPRRRVEDPRQAVLHAPVELVGTFQEKARHRLRPVRLVPLTFLVGFGHGFTSCSLLDFT